MVAPEKLAISKALFRPLPPMYSEKKRSALPVLPHVVVSQASLDGVELLLLLSIANTVKQKLVSGLYPMMFVEVVFTLL